MKRVCDLSPGDRGKAVENLVKAWLEEQNSRHDFAWHRFPDSRAARGALAAQPCDFVVGTPRHVVFLEVKETAEANRLPKAKIGQYGMLLKWSWTRSVKVIVLVYRSHFDDWVLLDQHDLFDHMETPTSFPFKHLPPFKSHVDALMEVFL